MWQGYEGGRVAGAGQTGCTHINHRFTLAMHLNAAIQRSVVLLLSAKQVTAKRNDNRPRRKCVTIAQRHKPKRQEATSSECARAIRTTRHTGKQKPRKA
jgi:hypothetical protein